MSSSTTPARSVNIGPIEVSPPVVLAPMAGVTTPPFRALCRRFGAGLYVSEMLTARAIVENHTPTLRHASFALGETPRSIQIYGTDPTVVAEAVRRLVDPAGPHHVDHVDLNFGCPARKITRHGGGAAVPWRRRLLGRIIGSAVRAAGAVPVTAKFRLGLDADHLTFLDAGRIAESEGAAAIALHARTAEQLYSGRADWDAIARLKRVVQTIPVLGNGDIWEAGDAVEMVARTGCDGVIVGRGCLGRPWLFRDLADAFASRPLAERPTLGETAALMIEHARLLENWAGERGVREFRKHVAWYTQGYRIGPLRRQLAQVSCIDELEERLALLDHAQPFPVHAMRALRGHTHGPRPVTLPEGFLRDRDDPRPPGRRSELVASGG